MGFLVGFIVFLSVFFVFFQLGPSTSTLQIIMDVRLNFWAKFQNCPNNCLIWFYYASLDPVSFFVLIQSEPYQPHSIPSDWGAHAVTGVPKSVLSPNSPPEKASIPQIEIWSTRNQ